MWLAVRMAILAMAAAAFVAVATAARVLSRDEVTRAAVETAFVLVLRFLCVGLGFFVRVQCSGGGRSADAAAMLQHAIVIVCNHVSQWDGIPFRLITPVATLVRETYTHNGAAGRAWARLVTA